MFMGASVFEIAAGRLDPPPPPLVKGVGTKRLRKGRVNVQSFIGLALMVPEIIRGGFPEDPSGPLDGKKAWSEQG